MIIRMKARATPQQIGEVGALVIEGGHSYFQTCRGAEVQINVIDHGIENELDVRALEAMPAVDRVIVALRVAAPEMTAMPGMPGIVIVRPPSMVCA